MWTLYIHFSLLLLAKIGHLDILIDLALVIR